ncbi:ABC transporter permease [Nitratireductor sp. StC3]|uniref:ABC transporter permease n=1 Tax=Nitratireductor sp. StC3 TaxID=2126741 RepID=UPI000D0CEF5A|nr:ABC transporter permease [Nitratireductor sp. StC3]PSM15808.1 ABC transporter permease [Nitratireductor sp. StC3]
MTRLLALVLRRLGLGLFTLLGVSLIIFFSVDLLPGGFAEAILGQAATPEAVAAINRELGLDQPFWVRYLEWIGAAVQGDFGVSFSGRSDIGARHVTDLIAPRLANTLFLAGVTGLVAVTLSLTLGLLAALYRDTLFDRTINVVSLTMISVPEFFLGYMLILVLAVNAGWFPALSSVTADMALSERLWRVALPATVLTLVISAHMMRMTRTSIINLLGSAYIEMAHLRGFRRWVIILRHALPNAWAPIANVIAFNLAYLIVGVVVVEVVFVYPGIGQLMVDAVVSRDIPVVQACSLLFAMTYIGLNLLADVVAIASNPRLLHPK